MYKKSLKTLLIAGLISMFHFQAQAQYHADYEIMAGRDDKEIIYKGAVTFEEVGQVPAFNLTEASGSYKPNADAITYLKQHFTEYNLVVFLGTWCEDSHRMTPQFYRVLNDIQYPFEKLSLYAVDRDKKDKEGMSEKYDVKLVPVIIVLKDGVEVGRITEVTDKSVEQDLVNIIRH